jgi:hypothetical protein
MLKPRPNRLDHLTKTAFLNRPDLRVGTEGEFKGWRTWSHDNFETDNGPFWHRMDDQDRVHRAFRVQKSISAAWAMSMAFAGGPRTPRRTEESVLATDRFIAR